jgi:hypothetical protein
MLIFEHIFNAKQDNYEKDKNNSDPFYPLVVFLVEFLVLTVGKEYHKGEKENKKGCEN